MDFEDNNPLSAADQQSPRPIITDTNTQIVDKITISVSQAQSKQRSYIEYTIRLSPTLTVRRRFSDFFSLHQLLRKQFPCVLVPPIPEKPGLGDLAHHLTTSDETDLVKIRKHALALFLNRCKEIHCINNCDLFNQFLDPKIVWSNVLSSKHALQLNTNPLKLPPDGSEPSLMHNFLPIVPAPKKLPVKEVENANISLEKHARKLVSKIRKLGTEYGDLSKDLNTLGLEFNSTSLSFFPIAEKTSLIVDSAHKNTMALNNGLSDTFVCKLTENVQMTATARSITQYKEQRYSQISVLEKKLEDLKQRVAYLESLPNQARTTNVNKSFWDTAWGTISGQTDPAVELRDNLSFIERYESVLEIAKREAGIAAEIVKSELERYEEIRKEEIEEYSTQFVKQHIKWAESNLEVWKEAKRALGEA